MMDKQEGQGPGGQWPKGSYRGLHGDNSPGGPCISSSWASEFHHWPESETAAFPMISFLNGRCYCSCPIPSPTLHTEVCGQHQTTWLFIGHQNTGAISALDGKGGAWLSARCIDWVGLWKHMDIWLSRGTNVDGDCHKLCFPAFLATRCGHMTEFSLIEHELTW